ncbi:MacB-like periplasmic core domain protein [uncultured archaeon]|nr:MacB-like periplasmic core domain protein [uncultured archaeon]
MKIAKSFKLALNILVHSKLRSWLTILGIVIGVAAIVAIVSIGEGLKQNVQSRLQGMGADQITISPGGGRAQGGFRGPGGPEDDHGGGSGVTSEDTKNLTKIDLQVLRSVPNVAAVQGIISGRGEAYYLAQTATLSVQGVDPTAYNEMTSAELESGRFLGPSDYNAIVVGYSIASRTFKQPLALNRIITIEGKPFKIVGILKESGSMGGDDNRIIMPIDAARDTLPDMDPNRLDTIIIKAATADDVDQVTLDADTKLMMSRHKTNSTKDYSIRSAKEAQARMASISSTLTLFLGAIAAVSLLVGAIGITNTMFTSVLEKTKEIGIMKAIGAKNRDILMIFMLNAALVGAVGGLLGIALGTLTSKLLPLIGLRLMGGGPGGMTTAVTPQLVILAFAVAVGIGIIAGAIPAYRASKLKPVDALRYE